MPLKICTKLQHLFKYDVALYTYLELLDYLFQDTLQHLSTDDNSAWIFHANSRIKVKCMNGSG